MTHALLNLGCGATFHAAWINIDTVPAAPGIIAHDLRQDLPFPDAKFEAVYASHVLEHLAPEEGGHLLRECHRVLQPGGILRVAVPDLEVIARLYLRTLEGGLSGNRDEERRYDWMMLELYDQTVRTQSGGSMTACIAEPESDAQRQFINSRIGRAAAGPDNSAPSAWRAGRAVRRALRAMRARAALACAYAFLGREGIAALQEGLFRRSGEIHRWMYDRFSLSRALTRAGFESVATRSVDESAIDNFARYGLESANGTPRKPDSLYVEARKPQQG